MAVQFMHPRNPGNTRRHESPNQRQTAGTAWRMRWSQSEMELDAHAERQRTSRSGRRDWNWLRLKG
jgi:hypothetical protein